MKDIDGADESTLSGLTDSFIAGHGLILRGPGVCSGQFDPVRCPGDGVLLLFITRVTTQLSVSSRS